MTTHRIIDYPQGLDLNSICQNPVPLKKADITDEKTDMGVSLKVVDSDGQAILLLEVEPRCIDNSEPEKNIMGCYIRRFEYVADFFRAPYSSIRDSFITAFELRLMTRPVPLKPNGPLTNYSYIWAEIGDGAACVITELLDLPIVSTNGPTVIHKKFIH